MIFQTFAKRQRAGFDFLLSVFMVIHYAVGRGVHPMKRIWQLSVILKVRLNKKGRKPTGFLYFVFDSGMVELRQKERAFVMVVCFVLRAIIRRRMKKG